MEHSPSSSKLHELPTEQEVFLSFNYRNLFEKVIIAYYEDGKYYLPLSEIFNTLKIPYEVNTSRLTMNGSYLEPENSYRFDFANYTVSLDSRGSFSYTSSQMLVKEMDFYVELEVLSEVFNLNFTVDLNNLLLQLQTPEVLPIVREQERAERRRKAELQEVQQNFYPLEYDRDRDLLGGGFLDYSLSANLNESINFYTYNFDLGTEVLGGDLQGSAFGSYSEDYSNFTTNNLRWRYVMRNNRNLTQIFAGQTNSDGLINRNFTGIRLTNEPIEPRFLYDSYEIEGRVEAGSEVELYYNNNLYDYKRVTDTGQYRFLAPLTYGTSRLRLRIYGPDGSITEREERIQIPFSFLPKGEFSYHLNAGRLNNAIFGSGSESNIVQGDFAYGISSWLTQKAGIEYFNEFSDQTPLIYSSTSARVLDEYLFNLDIAPNAFYRISGNVVYPNSASWGINYTYFTGRGIYNPLGYESEVSGNVFVPFRLSEIPFNLRVTGNYAVKEPLDNSTYTIDLNSRINRLNLRLSYRDREFGRFNLSPGTNSSLAASATYLVSRKPEIPWYLQNTFISGSLEYNPGLSTFEEAELQASRSVFDKGRLQASFSRNFLGNFSYINVGLTIDFNSFRSTSTARNIRRESSFTQNIRGSVGFDDFNNDVVLSNRQQVGRSATSLRLYVDSNNSGSFDEGDDVINDEAVRIGKAGVTTSSKNGILRFSQLQAYHRVNMEINESAIKNPLLIPQIDQFSIVTDPNQYKPINIPFYVSGVIEGRVRRLNTNGEQTAPGIRLYLRSEDGDFEREIQTFSDGSFYAYEVPPGNYSLQVDSTQLQFLDARTEPEILSFEVESLAEGDFVEDLRINIVPKTATSSPDTSKTDPETTQENPITEKQDLFYQIQMASYATASFTLQAVEWAEELFPEAFYIRYNPNANLYGVRTAVMTDKKRALQKYAQFKESRFNEPAIVVSRDSAGSSRNLYPGYAVLFGTLKTQAKAEDYAQQVAQITGYESEIEFIESDTIYSVRSKTFENRDDAVAVAQDLYRRSISSESKFSLVRVGENEISGLRFEYAIEVTGLSGNTVREYQNLIRDRRIIPESTRMEITDSTIRIEGISSWSRTVQTKRQLDRLLKEGMPVIFLKQYNAE
ncbi:hypothetical protein G3570_09955 [Balneolaceae bacterium YR4-1]|uniref:SPOR domain-containing protein n=1 Tax=Halalkalibaculum roseum TaxID=2709311 RepID=A0A6M1T2H0_9BACT|nr:hypothetical protein [Halalkalibaculum roseum]